MKTAAIYVLDNHVHAGRKVRVASIPGKGRGVFATDFINKGELIESCPVIPAALREEDAKSLWKTDLLHYVYNWIDPSEYPDGDPPGMDLSAFVLGYGMIYNHSSSPNARYERDYPARLMNYIALCDIPAGAEICVDYGIPLWFEEK